MSTQSQRYLQDDRRTIAAQQALAAQQEAKKHKPKPNDVSTFQYLRDRGWKHVPSNDNMTQPHWENEERKECVPSATEAVLKELERERQAGQRR